MDGRCPCILVGVSRLVLGFVGIRVFIWPIRNFEHFHRGCELTVLYGNSDICSFHQAISAFGTEVELSD